MQSTVQQQTVIVDRGLFLVRYAAAEDQEQPPKVKVSADPPSNRDISFVLYPDHDEPVLWQPDTCLVVRVNATAKLAVQVVPFQEGGSTAATVRIEPLSQGEAPPASARSKPQNRRSNDPRAVCVLGHLTGVGDVTVNADEWLAGPSAPSRIEGIALGWPAKPSDLGIRYAVKTAKPHPISGRVVEFGSFAGTRGKAMPIVALMLEISGPVAADFEFVVEAIFLGSPVTRMIGKRIVATGPTGREPLVGLRLDLKRVSSAAAKPRAQRPSGKSEQSTDSVRVFRGRQRYKQPASA
jgi:hypothetical protein